jgi:signal transduction histidine kinase
MTVRVVLVDDAEPLRVLLRVLLTETGRYEVVADVGTGEDGIRAVGELRPDVVLLDLSMPGMDGLTALPLMRAASPDTRIVVLTGYAADSAREAALAAGAHHFVEKGVRPQAILAAVDEAARTTGEPEPITEAVRPSHAQMDPTAVVGQLAHDLRSPLLAAHGLVRLVSARIDGDEHLTDLRELTDHAVQALDRAEGLVTATLRYVREGIDLGELVDVDVEAVLQQIVAELGTEQPHVAVDLRARVRVRAEPAALSRVLGNLLGNAVRYGGSGVEVASTELPDAFVRISVLDRGPGFSPADRDRLFALFARGSASAGHPGSGLGLAVSAKLVERMHGRLWAENRVGGGAAFHLELPGPL